MVWGFFFALMRTWHGVLDGDQVREKILPSVVPSAPPPKASGSPGTRLFPLQLEALRAADKS